MACERNDCQNDERQVGDTPTELHSRDFQLSTMIETLVSTENEHTQINDVEVPSLVRSQSPTSISQDDSPLINLEFLMKKCNNNWALLQQKFEEYCETLSNCLRTLQLAIQCSHWDKVYELSDRIANNSREIGATDVLQKASNLCAIISMMQEGRSLRREQQIMKTLDDLEISCHNTILLRMMNTFTKNPTGHSELRR